MGRLGLEGDAHTDDTVHGGPHRAVCLYAIEAIRRVQAEGHPIEAGSAGENLTTEGVELATLPLGTRLAIGQRVVLEVAWPALPCRTIRYSFRDGRYGRISTATHPIDSRMYARVLEAGEVRPGDAIHVLPPAPDSTALADFRLTQLEAVERQSSLALWRAAGEAGCDVRIVDDGELAMAASPELPGPEFNSAQGLSGLPHLVERALDHFRAAACVGTLVTATAPWPGAVPETRLVMYGIEPDRVERAPDVEGLTIRTLAPDEWASWRAVLDGEKDQPSDPVPTTRRGITREVFRAPHRHHLLAALNGAGVGVAVLQTHHGKGWMRAAFVRPGARGRGIQRALIAARAHLAAELGCDLVGASAVAGTISSENLRAIGLLALGLREHHRFDPGPKRLA